jgi:hypothetical protein
VESYRFSRRRTISPDRTPGTFRRRLTRIRVTILSLAYVVLNLENSRKSATDASAGTVFYPAITSFFKARDEASSPARLAGQSVTCLFAFLYEDCRPKQKCQKQNHEKRGISTSEELRRNAQYRTHLGT